MRERERQRLGVSVVDKSKKEEQFLQRHTLNATHSQRHSSAQDTGRREEKHNAHTHTGHIHTDTRPPSSD